MKYLKKIGVFYLLLVLLIANCQLLPAIVNASILDDLKEQIKEREEEIKQLEEQANEYQQNLKQSQQQKNTLQNQLAVVGARIQKLRADINITSVRISASSLKIEELTLEIYEKTQKIEKHKDNIAGIIRTIYEYDEKTLLELILENDKFSDFLTQIEYIELLQKNVQNDLESLKAFKSALEEQRIEVKAKKQELQDYNAQLYSQKQIEDSQSAQKAYLLRQTKGREKEYQQLLADIEEKQKQVREEIFELEEKLRLTLDPESIPKFRSGILSWPNEGLLTQYYGYTPYSKRLYKSGFHNGIDISAGYGAPIYAADDGIIKEIGDTDRYCRGGAYGKWIAIEHNNNLTTLYAHLSAFGKYRVGDTIKDGAVIGYEGSTGYSTGSHLHFGVYASNTFMLKQSIYCGLLPIGATVNPMNYL